MNVIYEEGGERRLNICWGDEIWGGVFLVFFLFLVFFCIDGDEFFVFVCFIGGLSFFFGVVF